MTDNWEAILAVASALIAVGAMSAAISQARSAKGAWEAADKAVVEAKRSADASEVSAEAAARSAAADEEMARLAKEKADREARYVVPWRVEPIAKSSYRLVNASDEDAVNVYLHGDVEVMSDRFENGDTLRAGSGVQFFDVRDMQSREDLKVEWERPRDAESDGPFGRPKHEWEYPL
ncbi:hypothetical protein ACWFMI_23420 [Nocardiopsis terrae]